MIILVSLWNIFLWLDCCAHVDLHAPKPTQISLHHARFSHLLLIYALLSIGYASWLLKVKILPIHWISWLLFNTRSSFDGRIWMASPKKRVKSEISLKWCLILTYSTRCHSISNLLFEGLARRILAPYHMSIFEEIWLSLSTSILRLKKCENRQFIRCKFH